MSSKGIVANNNNNNNRLITLKFKNGISSDQINAVIGRIRTWKSIRSAKKLAPDSTAATCKIWSIRLSTGANCRRAIASLSRIPEVHYASTLPRHRLEKLSGRTRTCRS